MTHIPFQHSMVKGGSMAGSLAVTAGAAAAVTPAEPCSPGGSAPSTGLSYSNSSSASSTGSFQSETSCGDSESVGADSTIEGHDYHESDVRSSTGEVRGPAAVHGRDALMNDGSGTNQ